MQAVRFSRFGAATEVAELVDLPDPAPPGPGEVVIDMTRNMTKDESTAKKMMADAAVAQVKKNYSKHTVKMITSTL